MEAEIILMLKRQERKTHIFSPTCDICNYTG